MSRLLHMALLLLALPLATLAQPSTDQQLAAQYFQNGDYERAALYYEKLYREQKSTFYYEQLFKSLVALERYEEAEKLAKDRLRKDAAPRYNIDLGLLYERMGSADAAAKQFQQALKDMPADQNGIRQVANDLIRANKIDLALEAYERGRRTLRDGNLFSYEIANLYGVKGDTQRMVSAYMDLLSLNEAYIQSVQNALARHIDFSTPNEGTEILRTEVLRRTQRTPEVTIFPELLIWMYVQQKDITSAMVQSKALDKRLNGNGERLMELGDIALANREYSSAAKCYQYVVDLGSSRPNYLLARISLVEALNAKVIDQAEPSTEELRELERQFEVTVSELGRTPTTTRLLRGQARLKAYYLGDIDGAIATLNEALATPGLDPRTEAELKLDLGDVHLLAGAIWEASLLYSQVDLDFKYDLIGHDARFRNAKVSFYAGDLLWCQAQLDVLKASTSKLIANDAMELSLLISDNYGLDSNSAPLSFFARAQLLSFQHRYTEALATLDSLETEFPMHSLGDEMFFARFRIARDRHRYEEAASWLVKLTEQYPLDILMDNALLELGKLYEERLNDPEKAMAFYERLLFEHTGSIFVPEARKRFRNLRGDIPEERSVPEPTLEGPP